MESTAMSNDVINGLWIGKIDKPQYMSINSFLKHGHRYQLWTYEPEQLVPVGTIIKDANEIVSKSILDKWRESKHRLQTFANYFRYKLIYKIGGWWMDLDCICVKSLDFESHYVFCSIDGVKKRPQLSDFHCHVINGAFKSPPRAKFLSDILIDIDEKASTGDYPDFGIWGTVVFTRSIFNNKLERYLLHQNVFVPFGFNKARNIFEDPTLQIPDWAYTVHLYNYTQPDYARITPGTVYEHLMSRYG